MPETEFAPDINHEVAEPRSVDDARDAIADTRERISATLDAIEARIDDTRAEIRRRADVLRPVRERIVADPWKALAIGAGAGLLLGLVTGGGDEKEKSRPSGRGRGRGHHRSRSEARAQRARDERLLRAMEGRRHREPDRGVLDDQEEEIRELPGRVAQYAREKEEEVREIPARVADYARDKVSSAERFASTRERIVDHLLTALAGAVTDGLSKRFHRSATD